MYSVMVALYKPYNSPFFKQIGQMSNTLLNSGDTANDVISPLWPIEQ